MRQPQKMIKLRKLKSKSREMIQEKMQYFIIIVQMNNKIFTFQNQNIFAQALTNKIHELEFSARKGKSYPYGNNEEFVVLGQMLLEFFFSDYLIQRGFPNKETQIKKSSDLVLLRQRLINERNLSDIALQYNLQNFVQVGNQITLKKNPKILAETLKALIAAQFYDSGFDLDHEREILQPIIKQLLDKGENVPLVELKQNAKSAFLEFINTYSDLKPKVSIEWSKDGSQVGNSANVYSISLEMDNYFSINRQGLNKRNTEQLVYLEALKRLKSIQSNQHNQQKRIVSIKNDNQKKSEEQESIDKTTVLDDLETSAINTSNYHQFSEIEDGNFLLDNSNYQRTDNKVDIDLLLKKMSL